MRNPLSALLLGLTLFACKEEKPVVATFDMPEGVSSEQMKENPFLGVWINSFYTVRILATKSPYEANEKAGKVSELSIDEKEIMLVYNNAEGERLPYTVSENDEGYIIELPGGMSVSKRSSIPQLIVNEGKDQSVMTRSFSNLDGVSNVEVFVRSELIVGTYTKDGLEQAPVEFKLSGELIGIPGYSAYSVVTRFDDLCDFDAIELIGDEGSTYVGWELDGDDLILYKTEPGTDYIYSKGREWLRLSLIEAIG